MSGLEFPEPLRNDATPSNEGRVWPSAAGKQANILIEVDLSTQTNICFPQTPFKVTGAVWKQLVSACPKGVRGIKNENPKHTQNSHHLNEGLQQYLGLLEVLQTSIEASRNETQQPTSLASINVINLRTFKITWVIFQMLSYKGQIYSGERETQKSTGADKWTQNLFQTLYWYTCEQNQMNKMWQQILCDWLFCKTLNNTQSSTVWHAISIHWALFVFLFLFQDVCPFKYRHWCHFQNSIDCGLNLSAYMLVTILNISICSTMTINIFSVSL